MKVRVGWERFVNAGYLEIEIISKIYPDRFVDRIFRTKYFFAISSVSITQ
jgi:hypothetical protein